LVGVGNESVLPAIKNLRKASERFDLVFLKTDITVFQIHFLQLLDNDQTARVRLCISVSLFMAEDLSLIYVYMTCDLKIR
jgi:hypothetical protein